MGGLGSGPPLLIGRRIAYQQVPGRWLGHKKGGGMGPDSGSKLGSFRVLLLALAAGALVLMAAGAASAQATKVQRSIPFSANAAAPLIYLSTEYDDIRIDEAGQRF